MAVPIKATRRSDRRGRASSRSRTSSPPTKNRWKNPADGSGRRINDEDLAPPADEAAALFPGDSLATRRGAGDRSIPARSGWNASSGGPKAPAGARSDAHSRDDGVDFGKGRDGADRSATDGDDDGPIHSRPQSNRQRPAAWLARVRSSKTTWFALHRVNQAA